MAQYEVPQFIERETRIFGPITLRQFLSLAVLGGIVLLLYLYVPFSVFVVLAVLVASIGVSIIFIQFNGRPLSTTILSMASHFTGSRSYVWKRKTVRRDGSVVEVTDKPQLKLNKQKLERLAELLSDPNS